MIIYLVGNSTIPQIDRPERFEHVLFSKFSYPKKCFQWFIDRKVAESAEKPRKKRKVKK